MKIPKKVKIDGINYIVKKVKVGEEPPLMKNHADGQTNYGDCIIYLDAKLNKQRMFQIFMHEIIHAIEWANDLSSSESYIQSMSSGLFQVLKDNNLLKEGE